MSIKMATKIWQPSSLYESEINAILIKRQFLHTLRSSQ
ncbi:hypothetical protein SAMN06265350_10540 [Solitalea koreensis]|uniref:Uncharacterized protein n=1 Tax=Solitalea koreensis TaxID=543615 RepID=A0A521CYF6_9SPHI|nr:hypothetical protein SAMN06265350_10540 [Solitalea koreensis]